MHDVAWKASTRIKRRSPIRIALTLLTEMPPPPLLLDHWSCRGKLFTECLAAGRVLSGDSQRDGGAIISAFFSGLSLSGNEGKQIGAGKMYETELFAFRRAVSLIMVLVRDRPAC